MTHASNFRMLAAVAVVPLLFACDPVTYGQVVIESRVPLDACLSKLEEQLRAEDGIKVMGSVADSRSVQISRGTDTIGLELQTPASTRVTLSFKWLGTSGAEEERGPFRWLDELHARVLRTCALQDSDFTLQRRCSAQRCKQWLKSDPAA
jgi:hypothetical protein